MAFIGWQRERERSRFSEIKGLLNDQGITINERSVGRLYRLYQALIKGGGKQVGDRLARVEQAHGGLILAGDGLKPDGCGGTLCVLYEVLSGTPVSAMGVETADAIHLTAWLRQAPLAQFKVLATMSDREEALVMALNTVWSDAAHQLCQAHFLSRLSEPVHDADQALQARLQAALRALPRLPKLRGDPSGERRPGGVAPAAPDELEPNSEAPRAASPPVSPSSQKKGERRPPPAEQPAWPGPLLKHLLFPQRPLQPIDPQNGRPVSRAAVLWNHYYHYYRQAIQDALARPRRKPFQLGGLAGYDQLGGS